MRIRIRAIAAIAATVGVVASFAVGERDAQACGGCFTPPENPTVVTDHRMVLTISKTQTTLYDQIRYQGDPSSFAWVLPISGVATVGLSSNVLFQSIDQFTQTQIIPPSRGATNGAGGTGGTSSSGGGSSSGGDSVTVLKAEQVGPYETVQLRSTDPQALTTWLGKHGFSIGEDVKAIVAGYVAQSFDFLAIKLVPGAGIREMRPVRITTAGASPSLPLRMVAAGAGATLGVTLWVVGEGRYEPQNFPWFRIDDSMLVWDFSANTSNYKALRQAFTLALGGRGWEMESSINVPKDQITNTVRARTSVGGDDTEGYVAVDSGVYGSQKTAEQVREEDLASLFSGIVGTQARITRIRADLSKAGLVADLGLQASSDQDVLSNIHQVTRTGDASCVGCANIQQPSFPPSDPNTPPSSSGGTGGGTFTCSNAVVESTTKNAIGWIIVAGGAVLAIRARRRRRP